MSVSGIHKTTVTLVCPAIETGGAGSTEPLSFSGTQSQRVAGWIRRSSQCSIIIS